MIALRRGLFGLWTYATLVVLSLAALPTVLGPPSWTLAFVRAWMKLVLWGLRVIMGIRVEFRGL
jgi:1-acyl-sn-glycerol-3-phosphate acyltransferase